MLKKFFKIIFSRFEGPPQMPQTPNSSETPKENDRQIFSYFEAEKQAEERRKTEETEAPKEDRPVPMFEELERRFSGQAPDIGAIEKGLKKMGEERSSRGKQEPREITEEGSREKQEPQRTTEEEPDRPMPFGSEPELKKHLGERFGTPTSQERSGAPQEAAPSVAEVIDEIKEDKGQIPSGHLFEEMEFKKREEIVLPGHQFEGVLEEVKTQSPEAKQEIEKIDGEYKKFLKDAEIKISAIKDPEEQSKEYLDFIKSQILKRGDIESAKAFAGLIKHREQKDEAAEEIAKSMEKAGLPEKEIVDFIGGKEGIKDKTKRDGVLKDLRKILETRNAVNENLDKQLELISKITDEGKRNEAVAILAFEAAIMGNNLEWAHRLIMAITKDEIREKAASHIVKELAEKGKSGEMKPLLEEIKNGDLKSETIGVIRETMERKLLGLRGIMSPNERERFNQFKEALKQVESSPGTKAKAEKWGKVRKVLLKILGWAAMIFGILALGAVGLALEKVAGQQKKG